MGSALQKAMNTLTAQWYNAVVDQCGFDRNTFQLVQGNQTVGTTSQQLWQFFDSVPPLSVTNYLNPTSFNSFAQGYGAVIHNLIPQGATELQNEMHDYYAQWLTYSQKSKDVSLQAFQNWAMARDPSAAPQWISLYRNLMTGAIFLAQQAWYNVLNATSNPGIFAYSKAIADVQSALQSSAGKTVTLNSSTESSSVTDTWADGEVAGVLDDFFGGGEGHYKSLSQKLATSNLSVEAKFTHLTVLDARPLSQPSHDPILSQYTPWYNSAALNMGYQENNNLVWGHSAPTWDDTFGVNGNLKRVCGALAVVDGVSVVVSSSATFTDDEQSSFEAAATAGFFPFFEASAEGGWSKKTSFDDQGHAKMEMSSPVGNPQILGAIVTSVLNWLG